MTQRFAAIGNISLANRDKNGEPIASSDAARVSAFFCSAADIQHPTYAICTGPNAQSLADDLLLRAPFRLIAPAAGKVGADIKGKLPGIYLIRTGKKKGPLSVEDAAKELGRALDSAP